MGAEFKVKHTVCDATADQFCVKIALCLGNADSADNGTGWGAIYTQRCDGLHHRAIVDHDITAVFRDQRAGLAVCI